MATATKLTESKEQLPGWGYSRLKEQKRRLEQIKELATNGLEAPQDAVGTLKKILSLLP
jgi:hypothetical protein